MVGLAVLAGIPTADDGNPVPMRLIDRVFASADLVAIENAVREVESRSPGEVVPYAVDRSDAYDAGRWALATLGSLLGGLASAAIHAALGGWGHAGTVWIVGLPASGSALGYLAATTWPGLRLRLVPAHTVEHRVQQRAIAAFVEEKVFRTRARTGVLVFLSLLERRVVILADTGISARVEQREWDAIVADIVAGMRRAEPGPTLAAAIRRCGALLAAHGFRARTGSPDELPDDLRRRSE